MSVSNEGESGQDQTVVLTKHHGLGNDFLIALEPPRALGSAEAQAWCNRHTGMGADGLLVATPLDEADRASTRWSMTLWNADGSRAEISGNGLRCLGQAIAMGSPASGPDAVGLEIVTDAGERALTVEPGNSPTWTVSAAMGTARNGEALATGWHKTAVTPHHQATVDMGNPHLVAVVDSVADIDMARVGPIIESEYQAGMNVHCIEVVDRGAISLVVWERGAGITQACGSGACAAAWAARQLNLVDDKIAVTMPGGSATVCLQGDDIELVGPATYIGKVELD